MTPRNVLRVAATVMAGFLGTGALTGTAYAFWTATGSGTGTASAGTAQSLTTTVASVTGGLLYPGGTGDVRLTVNNPNPFPVKISAVTSMGSATSSSATCDANGNGVTFTDRTNLNQPVPAGGSATFSLLGAAAMDIASDDACQGATFTLPVALTATAG